MPPPIRRRAGKNHLSRRPRRQPKSDVPIDFFSSLLARADDIIAERLGGGVDAAALGLGGGADDVELVLLLVEPGEVAPVQIAVRRHAGEVVADLRLFVDDLLA